MKTTTARTWGDRIPQSFWRLPKKEMCMDKVEEAAHVEEVNAQGPVAAAAPTPITHWIEGYDERTRKHIQFALDYAAHYEHGAPGHLDLMTIATLARHLSFALDVEPPYRLP